MIGQMSLFDFINRQVTCKIDNSFQCNHAEAKKVAISCGEDCKQDCCLSCKELCGARCNPSAHLQKPRKFNPGDWIEPEFVGKQMTFDEITKSIGNLIVMDMSTESHNWYKVVLVESIYVYESGERRLIYYDGARQRSLVDEMYFNESMRFPARAYRLKEVT